MRVAAKNLPKSSYFNCLNFKFQEKSIWHVQIAFLGIKFGNNSAFRDSLIAPDVKLDFCLVFIVSLVNKHE